MTILSSLTVPQLEAVIARYPWFTLARKELYLRTVRMGEEYRKLGMKRAGVYMFSRDILLNAVTQDRTGSDVHEQPLSEKNGTSSAISDSYEAHEKQVIRVIGGDWFSKEDLDSLNDDGLNAVERFTPSRVTEIRGAGFADEDFYTETLARVYAEQELYQMAIDVYSKLILIYPEKSAYFAALIKEQEKHIKE